MELGGKNGKIVILGGGLAGLSAGYALAKTGSQVLIFESDSTVGGLSKTISRGEYRFDLGGHRFFTKNKKVELFLRDLMGEELLEVPRASKIYLQGKYFDYPLKPLNAVFGMGISTTLKILLDCGAERLKSIFKKTEVVSLEDWVVNRFGHTMFDIYFKQYSEKVWGIDCSQINAEWVERRIQGLSLSMAIKNAFFKFSGKELPTLADKFLYPSLGIGRISDRLGEEIEKSSRVVVNTHIERVNHSNFQIESLVVKNGGATRQVGAREFISSIPMTSLVNMLYPKAPLDILAAASKLRYRDLVVVVVMLDRERVTDQTWIYIPEKKIALGRIHEPKNWSPDMSPAEKTLLVAEYFCFKGDGVWGADDEELVKVTIDQLTKLGFIKEDEVADSAVVRVPKAYPLLEVGYREHCEKIWRYLNEFKNLHVIGRGGAFRYLNMDHVIEAGLEVADKIIKTKGKDYTQAIDLGRLALVGDAE